MPGIADGVVRTRNKSSVGSPKQVARHTPGRNVLMHIYMPRTGPHADVVATEAVVPSDTGLGVGAHEVLTGELCIHVYEHVHRRACRSVYGHMNGHMYACVYGNELCMTVRRDTCIGTCMDMCMGTCMNKYIDIHV